MIRQYITVKAESPKDKRITLHKKYEVIGQIGDLYFVWANGHQSTIHKDNIDTMETIEIEDEGGEPQSESKRAWQKRAGHRRS